GAERRFERIEIAGLATHPVEGHDVLRHQILELGEQLAVADRIVEDLELLGIRRDVCFVEDRLRQRRRMISRHLPPLFSRACDWERQILSRRFHPFHKELAGRSKRIRYLISYAIRTTRSSFPICFRPCELPGRVRIAVPGPMSCGLSSRVMIPLPLRT